MRTRSVRVAVRAASRRDRVRTPRRGGLVTLVAVASVVIVLASGCDRVDRSANDQTVSRGAELYEANCAGCHGGAIGGAISDIPPPHNQAGHTWHHADCVLVNTVLEGMDRPDFPAMPAFEGQLTEEQVRSILAYIKTWWDDDQRAFQRERTVEDCD